MTNTAQSGSVRGAVRDAAYVITLDAPMRGNRLTVRAMSEFIGELRAAHDADALLLVIRAEGQDFCLGRLQGESVEGVTRRDSLNLILEANALLVTFPGVSVALVQGRANGFGAGLAVQCDLTVAEKDARFAFDEVEHGLAPLVVAEYLPRYIGGKRAQHLLLTGRELDARTAQDWGIVTDLVPTQTLSEAGQRLFERLIGFEPGALRLMKRYVRALAEGALEDPQRKAVGWLDDWLTAGRPPIPSPPGAEPAPRVSLNG